MSKLLRYQGAVSGDEEMCERLVRELKRVRAELAGSYGEGAFRGVDAVVEMMGGFGGEGEGWGGERGRGD